MNNIQLYGNPNGGLYNFLSLPETLPISTYNDSLCAVIGVSNSLGTLQVYRPTTTLNPFTSFIAGSGYIVLAHKNFVIDITPRLIELDLDNSVVDVDSSQQYYFVVDENITNFNLLIDGISGVSFQNQYSSDFFQCKLNLSTTPRISSSSSEVFVTNSVLLSTDTNKIFTFTYFNTGSLILGFSDISRTLTEPTSSTLNNSIVVPTPTPTGTPIPTPTATPTATLVLSPTTTPTATPTSTPTSVSTFNVTNNGSGNYIINESSNPTLTLTEGQTYIFNIIALGHPFWIKTTQTTGTSDRYDVGVTNNGTSNGEITFTVPFGAPTPLYYNCEFHASMAGVINITSEPVPTPTVTPTESVTPTPTVTDSVTPTPTQTATSTLSTTIFELNSFGNYRPAPSDDYMIYVKLVNPNAVNEEVIYSRSGRADLETNFALLSEVGTGFPPYIVQPYWHSQYNTLLFLRIVDDPIVQWVYKSVIGASNPFKLISKPIDIRNLPGYVPGATIQDSLNSVTITPFNDVVTSGTGINPVQPNWKSVPWSSTPFDYDNTYSFYTSTNNGLGGIMEAQEFTLNSSSDPY